jgi:hypothetical protein
VDGKRESTRLADNLVLVTGRPPEINQKMSQPRGGISLETHWRWQHATVKSMVEGETSAVIIRPILTKGVNWWLEPRAGVQIPSSHLPEVVKG